jgi:small ligand-binding sensory domain FIST
MPFAAALSTIADTAGAIAEVCDRALESLGLDAGSPNLALLFFSPHHAGAMKTTAGDLRKRLPASCLIGCCGEAIVGNDREIEQGPAMSLWLARWLKPMAVEPFHLTFQQMPNGHVRIGGAPDGLANADPQRSAILLLAEPSTFRPEFFLTPINQSFKGLPVMGGMASAGQSFTESKLLLNDTVRDQGAVGVLVSGACDVRGVVSHGCRPIGKPLVIRQANGSTLLDLDGKPPLSYLHQLYEELGARDQQLFRAALHIGRTTTDDQKPLPVSDFLVRNLIGMDRSTGSVTIDGRFSIGETVQFLLRDAETADANLHELLQRETRDREFRPGGALLFTCNRRGSRFFAQRDHDASALRSELGHVPLAGIITPGEIGPVAGQNFVHSYTASIAMFGD